MQLEYSCAGNFFQQSLRKAPQDSALGFKLDIQKWIVVVNLLQGEIPERSVFRSHVNDTLEPYLRLSQGLNYLLFMFLYLYL